jgi:hypothetical protein
VVAVDLRVSRRTIERRPPNVPGFGFFTPLHASRNFTEEPTVEFVAHTEFGPWEALYLGDAAKNVDHRLFLGFRAAVVRRICTPQGKAAIEPGPSRRPVVKAALNMKLTEAKA